jgi:hypothetical protein
MHGTIPSLPNMPSWRGAQLEHRDNFNLPYIYSIHPLGLSSGFDSRRICSNSAPNSGRRDLSQLYLHVCKKVKLSLCFN